MGYVKRGISWVNECCQLGTVLQQRWIPTTRTSYSSSTQLMITADQHAKSKKEDPCWRQNWRWVLFRVPESVQQPYYVCAFEDPKSFRGIATLYSISSKCFAARIGPEDMTFSVKVSTGEYVTPSLYEDYLLSEIRMPLDDMRKYIRGGPKTVFV